MWTLRLRSALVGWQWLILIVRWTWTSCLLRYDSTMWYTVNVRQWVHSNTAKSCLCIVNIDCCRYIISLVSLTSSAFGHETAVPSCSDAHVGDCSVCFFVDFFGSSCVLCRVWSISRLAVFLMTVSFWLAFLYNVYYKTVIFVFV